MQQGCEIEYTTFDDQCGITIGCTSVRIARFFCWLALPFTPGNPRIYPTRKNFAAVDKLNSIDSLRAEIARINQNRSGATGNWTIGQIYFHLAAAFEGSIEGLPPGYSPIARFAIRPFRWVLTRIRFPPFIPIPSSIRHKLEPPVDAVASQQYKRLLQAIEKFDSHDGDFPPHPVLGSLSRKEWIAFHIRHCQHHLAFIQT